MEAAAHPWPALGVLLLRDGLVSKEGLEGILDEQQDSSRQRMTSRRLGEILVERGVVTATQVARLLAEQYELPFLELANEDIDLEVARRLPEHLARRFPAVAVSAFPDGWLLLMISDPATVVFSNELREALGSPPRFAVVPPDALESAIAFVYEAEQAPTESVSPSPEDGVVIELRPNDDANQSDEHAIEEVHPSSQRAVAHLWPLLGAMLLREGLVTDDELHAALSQQRLSESKRLGEILIGRGTVTAADVSRMVAEQYELPFVELGADEVDSVAAALLPVELARAHSAIPTGFLPDGSLRVAVADPTNLLYSEELRDTLGVEINFAVATADSISAAIAFVHGRLDDPPPVTRLEIATTDDVASEADPKDTETEHVPRDDGGTDDVWTFDEVEPTDDEPVATAADTGETVDVWVPDEVVEDTWTFEVAEQNEAQDSAAVETAAPETTEETPAFDEITWDDPTFDVAEPDDAAEAVATFDTETTVEAPAVDEVVDETPTVEEVVDETPTVEEVVDDDSTFAVTEPDDAADAVATFDTEKTVQAPTVEEVVDEIATFDDVVEDDSTFDVTEPDDVEEIAHVTNSHEVAELATAADAFQLHATVAGAVSLGASSIHFSPQPHGLVVRARVDGVMRELETIPPALADGVTGRLVEMRGLALGENTLDVRVEALPTRHGERVTVHVHDQAAAAGLTELAMTPDNEARLRDAIEQASGTILVCGPTGSGKTTLLHAMLHELNAPERALTTIEDPVEIVAEGVDQIEVDPRTGLTMANGLRTILRSDSDVVLVGELRDDETRRLAISAAITGRLILSALHTRTAAAVVQRLIDGRVEPSLIADALTCVVGTRLARRVCTDCREPYFAGADDIADLGLPSEDEGRRLLARGRGCETCGGTGYNGRVGLHEVLSVTDEVRVLIASGASTTEIEQSATAAGMQTIREDGIRLCLEGITTATELRRIGVLPVRPL